MYLGKSYIEQCKNIFITSPAVKVQIQEYYKHNTQEGELYLANSCTKCNILLDYYLFINKREAFLMLELVELTLITIWIIFYKLFICL